MPSAGRHNPASNKGRNAVNSRFSQEKEPHKVRDMFTRIAPRYDLMNRVITLGMDRRWRRKLLARTALPRGGRLLDMGCGTGDIALAAMKERPDATVIAADFTPAMVAHARVRPGAEGAAFALADAMALPFPDKTFDAVVSGYLLRNVPHLPTALAEMVRVLKPGGRMAALDTAPVAPGPLAPFIRFYLTHVIPGLGGLIAGDPAAYTYLPETTKAFLSPEELARAASEAGFSRVAFQPFLFGTQTLLSGIRA